MISIEQYFKGDKLYGDDFTDAEILNWYKAEEEGYAGLIKGTKASNQYEYHAMNFFYGFKYLNGISGFKNVLGLGSAYGNEFLPLIHRIEALTIIEPSEQLRTLQLGQITPSYVKPTVDGGIDFSDSTFDLITCFGTLHHIPNVSFVLSEILRVMMPGGILLLREPIRTMGDWRYPRKGLTKNERGIPHHYFDVFFKTHNVSVIKKSFCESLFAYKLINKIFRISFTSDYYPKIDNFISKLFGFNIHYHPTSPWQKISPGSVFYVIKKNKY